VSVEEFTLTVVYESVDEDWVQARIAEMPAVITVGHDKDEARVLVVDALREYLIANAAEMATTPGEQREELTVMFRTAG
jgi:predicted RNase H-like HicB family nuclease